MCYLHHCAEEAALRPFLTEVSWVLGARENLDWLDKSRKAAMRMLSTPTVQSSSQHAHDVGFPLFFAKGRTDPQVPKDMCVYIHINKRICIDSQEGLVLGRFIQTFFMKYPCHRVSKCNKHAAALQSPSMCVLSLNHAPTRSVVATVATVVPHHNRSLPTQETK